MQEKTPLVTIVTVVYKLKDSNRLDSMKRCLESVKTQTYKNIEHLIIDGASTDGTVEFLEEYAKTGLIRYISENDSGIYNAMNKGMKFANGKYIAYLNSDDYYNNVDAIKLSIDALEKNNAEWSRANALIVNGDEEKFWEGSLDFIPFGMLPNHQTIFMRTELLRKLGGFDEGYRSMADNQLMMKLHSLGYKSVYVNEIIVTFSAGGASSKNDIAKQVVLDHQHIFYELYKDKLKISKKDCENLFCWNFMSLAPIKALELGLKLAPYTNWLKVYIDRYRSYFPDFQSQNDFCFKWLNLITLFRANVNGNIVKLYILGLPLLKFKIKTKKIRFYILGIGLAEAKFDIDKRNLREIIYDKENIK